MAWLPFQKDKLFLRYSNKYKMQFLKINFIRFDVSYNFKT